MFKKIALGVAVLVVVLAVGAHFLWSNLDRIVKAGVEKYGTAATQTEVQLDRVHLSPTSGAGTLSGLSVANPQGFSSAKAMALGSISVKLDTSSIAGSGPIVISQIVIDKPQVSYEVANNGSTNLQTLQRNTQTYASSMAGRGGPAGKDAQNNSGPGRKIVINDLVITNGDVTISQPALEKAATQGKPLNAPLPTIHLTNIGKVSGGATAAQVAQQVLGSIAMSASKVAVMSLAKEKIGGAVGGVTGVSAPGGIGDKLKGVLGQ